MTRHLLKEVLDKKKVTHAEFGRRLGMKPPGVAAFLRKGYNPKMAMLVRWQHALGLKSLDELVEAGRITKIATAARTRKVRKIAKKAK